MGNHQVTICHPKLLIWANATILSLIVTILRVV